MIGVFWCLVTLIGIAFVGFPVAVLVLGALLRRRCAVGDGTPSVSVVIAAYNEAGGIRAKIENALRQDYPADRLDVIVVDDGSTDGTSEAVSLVTEPRVRHIRLASRGGKVGALNEALAHVRNDIVVLTDANSEFEGDAVRMLVRSFSDPAVGGVCGNQLNRPGRSALAKGEQLYWEYDKLLKRMESWSGSIVAADGSIYAIRREHIERIPLGVTDDFFLSTGVVRQGRRLVFDADARAFEDALERRGDHYRRRVRITEQALLSLWSRRELLNPFRTGVYAFVLAGHKVVRRLAAPAFLLLVPVSAAVARHGSVYRLVFLGLSVLVLLGAFGLVTRGRVHAKLLAAPYYFALGCVATTVGVARFLLGRRSLMWEPVRR
jgi:cellulose synthase/poly-beta-1,6-N-acetylglucosamine synthase-like glycosyltransferase